MSTSITPFPICSLFSQWVDRLFSWYLPALPFIPPSTQNRINTAQFHSSVSTLARNGCEDRSLELTENPVHSPLVMKDAPVISVSSTCADSPSHSTAGSPASNSAADTTWLYHLQHNQRLYDFAIWTAIVYPLPYTASTPTATPSLYSESQIRWKQRWVIFCHFCSFIQICANIGNGIELCISNEIVEAGIELEAVVILAKIGTMIPVVTVLPLIVILKHSITQSLLIPDKTNSQYSKEAQQSLEGTKQETHQIPYLSENTFMRLNSIIVESIINHAISLGRGLFIGLAIMPFLFGLLELANIGAAVHRSSALALYYVFSTLEVWTMIPPTAMLIGIFTFIVMDQRYSYYMLLEMRQKALSNEVIDSVYLTIGKRLEERDANSPLNLITGIAIVMILICATNLIFYNAHTSASLASHIISSILLVFLVVKEILILLLITYFMREVNDMADQLLHQVNRRMSIEIKDERQRLRRVELLLMMKDYRIGSTVFYQRPSTTQLMVQFVSLSAAVLSALGKIIFNAIS